MASLSGEELSQSHALCFAGNNQVLARLQHKWSWELSLDLLFFSPEILPCRLHLSNCKSGCSWVGVQEVSGKQPLEARLKGHV